MKIYSGVTFVLTKEEQSIIVKARDIIYKIYNVMEDNLYIVGNGTRQEFEDILDNLNKVLDYNDGEFSNEETI